MKQFKALLLILIMLVGVMPMAFAEDNDTATDDESDETTVDEADEDDTKKSALRKRAAQATKKRIAHRQGDISDEDFQAMKEKAIQAAIEHCEGTDNPEKCKAALRARAEKIKELSDEQLKKVKKFAERKDEIKHKIKSLRDSDKFEKFKDRAGKARERAKTAIENARDAYKKATDRYKDAREKHDAVRDELREDLAEVKECERVESEECDELRAAYRERVVNFLTHSTDLIVEELNRILAKVDESETLTDEEAEEIEAKISDLLEAAEGIKADLEALEEPTKEELRDIHNRLKEVWQDTKDFSKRAVGKILNERFGGIVVKSYHVSEKLERILERMAENGKDTSSVQDDVDEFNELLEKAEDLYEQARVSFNDGNNDEARELVSDAKEALKEAHQKLKDIFQTLREIASEEIEEVEDTEEAEEEEESDDATDETDETDESDDSTDSEESV